MANSQHAEHNPKHVGMSGAAVVTSTPHQASSSAGTKPAPASAVPSFSEASELLSAPYSCLVLNTHRRHIALPPMYLHKKRTGIREELDAELLKFSQKLSGVPIAYDNIKIVGQKGDIYDDSGYIHLNIEASFIVFQPVRGQTLLGKVNKLGVSHVGCLVHGCFNASIPKPHLVSMETWRDAGPQIGTELTFDVTALDADTAGVLLIRGRLSRTRVQELLAMSENTVSTVQSSVQQPDEPDEAQTTEHIVTPSEETPKKKKKKKKDKDEEAAPKTPEEEITQDTTPELNGTVHETDQTNVNSEKKKKKKKKDRIKEEEIMEPVTAPFTPQQDSALDTTMETMAESNGHVEKKKKKKKKKDKHIKEEPEEIELSNIEVPGSDSSGYLSESKSSLKRKLKTEISLEFSPEFAMPSPKKIKTLIELKAEYE